MLISVITAVKNEYSAAATTLKSILKQNTSEIEWIVVCGRSNDGPYGNFRNNDSIQTIVITDPDKGVYDAFNKGVKASSGRWIIFLGAGDCLEDDFYLKFNDNLKDYDKSMVLYGKVKITNPLTGKYTVYGKDWMLMENKWINGRPAIPHHQGVLHHRDIFHKKGIWFDTNYRIASDGKLLLTLFQKSPPHFLKFIVSSAPSGGLSGNKLNRFKTAIEIFKINRELHIPINYLHEFYFMLRSLMVYSFSRMLNFLHNLLPATSFRK